MVMPNVELVLVRSVGEGAVWRNFWTINKIITTQGRKNLDNFVFSGNSG